MRHSSDNFLYAIKQIVTGNNNDDVSIGGSAVGIPDGGYKRDQTYPLNDVINATATITTAETGMSVLQTAASTNPNVGHVTWPVPRDYDEASDTMSIRVLVQLVNADASINIQGTPYIKQIGKAAVLGTVVAGVVPFVKGTAVLSQTEQAIDISFSGLGLKRDAVIDVLVAYVGTLTGAANIYGIEITYASCLVSYNETDLTQNATGTLPGFGNPLR